MDNSNIYTCIDIGSYSVKAIVLQKVKKHFNVIASVSVKSRGIKHSRIIDEKEAYKSIKKTIDDISSMVGVDINKILLCISPQDSYMDIIPAKVKVKDKEFVTGEDISSLIADSIKGQSLEKNEIVTAFPIKLKLDGKEVVDPKGKKGKELSSRVVISTTPKKDLYVILKLLKQCGVDVVDIAYTSTGDYYMIKNKEYDSLVGAVVNIGYEDTNISIFNKGIQIKNCVIPRGSFNVDKDIDYIYRIGLLESKNLKENFVCSDSSYADYNEIITIGEDKKEIAQDSISKVVEARIREILQLVKSEIKNLTNRKISYIIVSGGLTEINGFDHLLESEIDDAKSMNLISMGARHNKFSNCYGTILYFDDKLSLRGKKYDMIENEKFKEALSISDENNIKETKKIGGKMFSHFFNNKEDDL